MPDVHAARYVSKCCSASIHSEDGAEDFPGQPWTARTMWFVCDDCGEPCDVKAKTTTTDSSKGTPP